MGILWAHTGAIECIGLSNVYRRVCPYVTCDNIPGVPPQTVESLGMRLPVWKIGSSLTEWSPNQCLAGLQIKAYLSFHWPHPTESVATCMCR